jgi:hypothetical protein
MSLLIRIKDKSGIPTNQCIVDGIIEIQGNQMKLIMRDNSLQILKRYTDIKNLDLTELEVHEYENRNYYETRRRGS